MLMLKMKHRGSERAQSFPEVMQLQPGLKCRSADTQVLALSTLNSLFSIYLKSVILSLFFCLPPSFVSFSPPCSLFLFLPPSLPLFLFLSPSYLSPSLPYSLIIYFSPESHKGKKGYKAQKATKHLLLKTS